MELPGKRKRGRFMDVVKEDMANGVARIFCWGGDHPADATRYILRHLLQPTSFVNSKSRKKKNKIEEEKQDNFIVLFLIIIIVMNI